MFAALPLGSVWLSASPVEASIQVKIRSVSAVLKVLSSRDHLSSHWIQMNVAHQFSQVPICLAEDRLVPPLKQMSDLLVLSIVVLTVCGEHAMHNTTDGIVLHLSQEMDMIRHQAVSVEVEGTLGFLVLEKTEKLKIVILRTEDAPPIISAGDDVIESASYFDSRFPCHCPQEYIPDETNVNISCLTPPCPPPPPCAPVGSPLAPTPPGGWRRRSAPRCRQDVSRSNQSMKELSTFLLCLSH
jgi:hypothetical protein